MTLDNNIVVIVGWIITILGFIVLWRKSNHEIKALDMGAIKDATETIENYSEQVKKLRDEVGTEKTRREAEEIIHKEEIRVLTIKIERLEKIVKDKDLEIEDLRDWAERLCNQILSISQVPVKIRVRSKKKNE